MREILFRGKAINREKGYHRTKYKNGDWVYGLITKPHNDIYPTLPMEMRDTDGINNLEVDYKTVGQFTGLTANGKKIFEGDIVKFTAYPFENSSIGVVCLHEGSFCIQYRYSIVDDFHQIGKTDRWEDMGASCIITYEYEIIGNIHDNPELLGEEK